MGIFDYKRRRSSAVGVGATPLGADNPVRIQSMTSTSTMDTDGSVAQAIRIIEAGGEYVRLTAQGVREATNLAEIRRELTAKGYATPLVADIHFNPRAAFAAAERVEKVRINPGNFVDPGRTFVKLEFTDEEYAREIQKIEDALVPFIKVCRKNHTAIRIGVNHGSLSDRIMSRYGDTPAGMVESAMEFLRVFRKYDFNDVVISIKASNTVVMTTTVRMLIDAMDREDMHYPIHLGVTEAGNGHDGRIKSALGIGAMLLQGIGDTVRVSLSEEPEAEIPVARQLMAHVLKMSGARPTYAEKFYNGFNPITPARRPSAIVGGVGGGNLPKAVRVDDIPADLLFELDADLAPADLVATAKSASGKILILSSQNLNQSAAIQSAAHIITDAGVDNPIIAKVKYAGLTPDETVIAASADLGAILLNSGLHDGIMIETDSMSDDKLRELSLSILQAARLRMTRTEYISCPGCGRTMFDLQTTVNEIKAATSHLPHLKIGVMGCIVNGPGEMADADYGYIGAGVGRVSLYRGKQCIEKNIPSTDALPRLISLLKADGHWLDP